MSTEKIESKITKPAGMGPYLWTVLYFAGDSRMVVVFSHWGPAKRHLDMLQANGHRVSIELAVDRTSEVAEY